MSSKAVVYDTPTHCTSPVMRAMIELDPQLPALNACWVSGYSSNDMFNYSAIAASVMRSQTALQVRDFCQFLQQDYSCVVVRALLTTAVTGSPLRRIDFKCNDGWSNAEAAVGVALDRSCRDAVTAVQHSNQAMLGLMTRLMESQGLRPLQALGKQDLARLAGYTGAQGAISRAAWIHDRTFCSAPTVPMLKSFRSIITRRRSIIREQALLLSPSKKASELSPPQTHAPLEDESIALVTSVVLDEGSKHGGVTIVEPERRENGAPADMRQRSHRSLKPPMERQRIKESPSAKPLDMSPERKRSKRSKKPAPALSEAHSGPMEQLAHNAGNSFMSQIVERAQRQQLAEMLQPLGGRGRDRPKPQAKKSPYALPQPAIDRMHAMRSPPPVLSPGQLLFNRSQLSPIQYPALDDSTAPVVPSASPAPNASAFLRSPSPRKMGVSPRRPGASPSAKPHHIESSDDIARRMRSLVSPMALLCSRMALTDEEKMKRVDAGRQRRLEQEEFDHFIEKTMLTTQIRDQLNNADKQSSPHRSRSHRS